MTFRFKLTIFFIIFGVLVTVSTLAFNFFLEAKRLKADFLQTASAITSIKQSVFQRELSSISDISKLILDTPAELLDQQINIIQKSNPAIISITKNKIEDKTISQNIEVRKIDNNYIIEFNYKMDGYIITIGANISDLIDPNEKNPYGFVYLATKDGNVLIHNNSQLQKNNLSLYEVFGYAIANDIKFGDIYVGEDMYSRKISLGEKYNILIILKMHSSLIDDKKDELKTTTILMTILIIILSIPLAFIFSIIPNNIKNIEVNSASDQNPLSKLPGNQTIKKYINDALMDENGDYFAYFDFNSFKPFNDIYGFKKGDEAIFTFTKIVKNELNSSYFVAHIGGDDFFVGAKKDSSEYFSIYSDLKNVVELFEIETKKLYTQNDQKNGFISAKDRDGNIKQFKLLSVSCAILEIHEKSKSKLQQEEITEILAKLKKVAKESEDNISSASLLG